MFSASCQRRHIGNDQRAIAIRPRDAGSTSPTRRDPHGPEQPRRVGGRQERAADHDKRRRPRTATAGSGDFVAEWRGSPDAPGSAQGRSLLAHASRSVCVRLAPNSGMARGRTRSDCGRSSGSPSGRSAGPIRRRAAPHATASRKAVAADRSPEAHLPRTRTSRNTPTRTWSHLMLPIRRTVR